MSAAACIEKNNQHVKKSLDDDEQTHCARM